MTAKVVVRLMGGGDLLGWTELAAVARGNRALWPMSSCTVTADRGGAITHVLLHWTEMDIVERRELPITPVSAGESIDVQLPGGLFRIDQPGREPLPPVTVRSASVGIPAGSVMAPAGPPLSSAR